MVNVDQNFDSIGVSEIQFRDKTADRINLVSGMMFISGSQLFYQSGMELRLIPSTAL